MSIQLPTEIHSQLEELSPAACAVYQALYHADYHLTTQEINEATGVQERTIRNALTQLQDAGLADRDEGIIDARKPRYYETGRTNIP